MARAENLEEIKATLGAVPGWLDDLPDEILNQQWTSLKWFLGDSDLSGRDKALVAFGAATATACEYWIPFHKAQLALNEFSGDQIKEAVRVVGISGGFSAQFHGAEYPLDKFKDELASTVAHLKGQAG